jgi:hypothetical protein
VNRPISGTLIGLITVFILWQTVSFFRQRGGGAKVLQAEPAAT